MSGLKQVFNVAAISVGIGAVASCAGVGLVTMINPASAYPDQTVRVEKAAKALIQDKGLEMRGGESHNLQNGIYTARHDNGFGIFLGYKPDAPKNALGTPVTVQCTTNMAAPTTGPVEMAGKAKCFIVKMG